LIISITTTIIIIVIIIIIIMYPAPGNCFSFSFFKKALVLKALFRFRREQRLATKKAAKARRSEIFQYGRRCLFFRDMANRSIAILRAFAFISVACEMLMYAYWMLLFAYHFTVYF